MKNLIDDDETTFWHCKTKSEANWCEPPYEITIDMKDPVTIAQIDLVNRGEASRANNIKWVEFYASNNNSNWEKIGASDFNDEFIRETFRYYVKSTTARYYPKSLSKNNWGTLQLLRNSFRILSSFLF